PAEAVRLAVARALAAAGEYEHAVAVPGEHARRLLRALAARERDHGRAVLRRHVPALEGQAVAGLERDVLVCRAELVLGHDSASGVADHVCEPDREADQGCDDEAACTEEAATGVAPGAVALCAAR